MQEIIIGTASIYLVCMIILDLLIRSGEFRFNPPLSNLYEHILASLLSPYYLCMYIIFQLKKRL